MNLVGEQPLFFSHFCLKVGMQSRSPEKCRIHLFILNHSNSSVFYHFGSVLVPDQTRSLSFIEVFLTLRCSWFTFSLRLNDASWCLYWIVAAYKVLHCHMNLPRWQHLAFSLLEHHASFISNIIHFQGHFESQIPSPVYEQSLSKRCNLWFQWPDFFILIVNKNVENSKSLILLDNLSLLITKVRGAQISNEFTAQCTIFS